MTALSGHLLPETAAVGADGLEVGGLALTELATRHGTPAFIYDQAQLESRCEQAVAAFPDGVAYATKAFLCKAMARLAVDAGMNLDVASGGEMHVALAAGVSPSRLVLHGNNKSDTELGEAIERGVGMIVLDSFDEIDRVEALNQGSPVPCLIRVTPGVEAHTHEFVMTGQDDSKFGFGLNAGDAQRAWERVRRSNAIELRGIHAHIGSQIFDATSFAKEVEVLAEFVRSNDVEELCVGGGLGVPYVNSEIAPSFADWGAAVHKAVADAGLAGIKITAEPGRSIVAQAGITLYTVGTIKTLPGIRTYLAVDGGMSDNPRPVLYGSGYEAFLPRAPFVERERTVTVVGKHCESGDVLIRDAVVPADIAIGDVLATPVTGAYGHTMASNYNRLPRPPVVFVKDGKAEVVVRRETYEDLYRLDA